nr:stage III sporulation protein AE [uncultured Blautia sp.]
MISLGTLCAVLLCLMFSINTEAAAQDETESQEEQTEKMLENMEMQQMQEAVNELLGENTFHVQEFLKELMKGEQGVSKKQAVLFIKEQLLSALVMDRQTFVQVLLLVLVAALFSNFTEVFGKNQTAEVSFYIVYMLLSAILLHSFQMISQGISEKLQDLMVFMKALMPSYFLAVTAASGSATAMVFYEMVMVVIYLIQVVLLRLVLPGIHGYVLLEMINYLHKEDFLSHMAELMQTVLGWTLKTCTGITIGMQLVQNMISPAVDSLKRNVVGKTAAAIPGIGNAINGVTETALATAVLIRNSLGVMGILLLLLLGLPPVIKLGFTALIYKLLAALVQPVSDKRLVGCLSTIGEGCGLLLKVLLTAEFLFMITIAVLTVSFVGN